MAVEMRDEISRFSTSVIHDLHSNFIALAVKVISCLARAVVVDAAFGPCDLRYDVIEFTFGYLHSCLLWCSVGRGLRAVVSRYPQPSYHSSYDSAQHRIMSILPHSSIHLDPVSTLQFSVFKVLFLRVWQTATGFRTYPEHGAQLAATAHRGRAGRAGKGPPNGTTLWFRRHACINSGLHE